MKKEFILKENNEYNRMISKIRPLKCEYYNVYLEKNNSDKYLFGFSVGKKLGNAVLRNKIKRQLKMIISSENYISGFKCIILVKKELLNIPFEKRKTELLKIIDKLGIIKK